MPRDLQFMTVDRARVAYLDEGQGTPVVLVHCSSASHREWRFAIETLADGHRVVAPDLVGYGESSTWSEVGVGAAGSDLRAVESLIEKAGEPVHLIGHSYGGAVCLEAARRAAEGGRDSVRSLMLIEPVAFHLLRTARRDKEWKVIARVARRCIEATARGDLRKAANSYMGFWLGGLRWRMAPKRFRAEVVRTVAKVADEFQLMFDYEFVPDDYSGIECPVTLVCGGRSPRPAAAVVEVLERAIDRCERIGINSAGHMSPFTHRREVGGLIQSHLGS